MIEENTRLAMYRILTRCPDQAVEGGGKDNPAIAPHQHPVLPLAREASRAEDTTHRHQRTVLGNHIEAGRQMPGVQQPCRLYDPEQQKGHEQPVGKNQP